MKKLAERAKYIQEMAAKLKPDTPIWAKKKGGPYYAGKVILDSYVDGLSNAFLTNISIL
jgi:hypothetical protein